MLSKVVRRVSVTPKARSLVTVNTRSYQTNLLIDGQWVKSSSGRKFTTYNPSNEEAIAEVQEGDKADIDLAVAAATRAFYQGPWGQAGGYERSRVLNKVADLIEKNRKELAELEVLDNGKSFFEAYNVDLPLVIHCYRYYAGWADKITGRVINPSGPISGDSHFSYLNYEPVGVVGQIIPWNFPLLMQAWKLGPALAAGCTIVLKPAEQTPLTALRVGELFLEAGLPAGVLNIVPGFGHTAGAAISNHTKLDKVAFTGSTEVGLKILQASTAGGNIKRVTLELGGKSPNIIFADSDIENAVQQSHTGVFLNQGQCCIAGTRMFVEEKVEVVERSTKLAKDRKVGNPMSHETRQGAQIDKAQFDKIMGLIGKGKEEGARLTTGGNRVGNKGYFVEPTVFADVKDEMAIAQEEIFGPVMSILPFKTIDEVVSRANNSIYGLGASIFTKDIGKAHYLSKKIRAGTVYVNCYDVFDAATPFGGFKSSGLGRELGPEGLQAYLEPKTVVMKIK